jgi:hypothetical protein
MYTFVPVAPCSFTVNGKHYDIKINSPITVDLRTAKMLTSTSFQYRKHLRLITPLPNEESVVKMVESVKPVIEAQPVVKIVEQVQEQVVEPLPEVKSLEVEKESKPSRLSNRRKKKEEEEEGGESSEL